MSWAAHEFENYFLQRHVGLKASFLAIATGALLPDLFTKYFVYRADDAARFHRGWPGVGFSHSLAFGVVLAAVVLVVWRNRAWALGLLIGQWAHVLTDVADTAGVMPFFPFSLEPVSISMWKHAAAEGRYGDAAAYYSGLGGVWDLAWMLIVVLLARRTLRSDYFRTVVRPADPGAWSWLHRRLHLSARGELLLYRGLFFYGAARMTSWFLYARFGARTPFQPVWGGPEYVAGHDLSDAGPWEVVARTAAGGVLFAATLLVLWRLLGARWWRRAEPAVPPGSPSPVTA